MLDRLKHLFTVSDRSGRVQHQLDQLRDRLPVPVFWMFGKTQSGKTSVIKYLTGADRAEIGKGFQPCTRFSSLYQFPTPEAPLAMFLDMRGLDEPGYDPAEDLARFNNEAHVVVVVVKVLDHAQENVLKHLTTLRNAQRRRPVVLVLTCLHEAYPQQQHPLPYPFDNAGQCRPAQTTPPVSEDLLRSAAEQRRRFEKVVDRVALVDLTPPEEGFNDPEYGGHRLRQELLEVLPAAVGQTLRTLDEATHELQDMYAREPAAHPRLQHAGGIGGGGADSGAGPGAAVGHPVADDLSLGEALRPTDGRQAFLGNRRRHGPGRPDAAGDAHDGGGTAETYPLCRLRHGARWPGRPWRGRPLMRWARRFVTTTAASIRGMCRRRKT